MQTVSGNYGPSLTVTPSQSTSPPKEWGAGKTWRLWLYVPGYDYGVLFTIQLITQQVQFIYGVPLGPNSALSHIKVPSQKFEPTAKITQTLGPKTIWSQPMTIDKELQPRTGPWDLLWAIYRVLNVSRSKLTIECQLCLDIKPPYYEGIAIPGNYTSTESKACCWQDLGNGRLTLGLVKRNGFCVAKETWSVP